MPPKSPKSAPRLITPAEPHYRPSRLTVTYLALLAVPVVLWLLYALRSEEHTSKLQSR